MSKRNSKNPPHTFKSSSGTFYYERIVNHQRFRESLRTKSVLVAKEKAHAIDVEVDNQILRNNQLKRNYLINASTENLTKIFHLSIPPLSLVTPTPIKGVTFPNPQPETAKAVKAVKKSTSAITMADVYARYMLAQVSKDIGVNTKGKKDRIRDIILDELKVETPVQLVTQKTLNDFKAFMDEYGYAGDTRNTYVKEYRTLLNWMVKQEIITATDVGKLEFGKQAKSQPRDFTLSREQVFAAIDTFRDLKFRLYFLTLWYTCARPGEVLGLKPLHFDLKAGTVSYIQNKTEKAKTVNVPDGYVKELEVYITANAFDRDGLLFPDLAAHHITGAWKSACKQAGIVLPIGIGAYCIRHSRVTDIAVKSNGNVDLIRLYSGDNIETAMKHYTNTTTEHYKDVMAAIDGK